MVLCHRCNTARSAGRRFCAECGAPLPLICAACGFENKISEKFCGGCGHSLKTGQPSAPDPGSYPGTSAGAGAAPRPGAAAATELGSGPPLQPMIGGLERRHLSILFCDLVGSADLCQRLDAEDLRLVICAYQRVASSSMPT